MGSYWSPIAGTGWADGVHYAAYRIAEFAGLDSFAPDGHGLYSQLGFTPVKAPERYRELHRADVYETRKIT